MNRFFDVVIVGSGVSGLYTALNLRNDLNVLVVCKDKITTTNTFLAQGGISVARNNEDIDSFIEDTLRAGQYKNDINAVKVLAEESIYNVEALINMGLNLDRNDDGTLNYTKEGAHSINRIVHTKDNTGESVARILIENVKKRRNITIYEDIYFADLIEKDNVCYGVILIKDEEQINIYAKSVVLACGGIGGLFRNSTNQRILKGDGIAAAVRHHIDLKDINYIQIHPTAFYEEDKDDRRLLISESLRGEGGKLTNINGERFVDELLPRDIVSQAVYEEMRKTDTPYVYLDIRFLGGDYIVNRFSSIYKACLEKGTDITKELIKVSPAQHFFMGGIKVNIDAETSMKNLYAVGEASCTGIHGANRLASNSLLEGLVFSRRGALLINKKIDNIENRKVVVSIINKSIDELNLENEEIVRNTIKKMGGKIEDELVGCR
ncbi:L-aspartate oxidase [uncultured Clostridium sp.]|uniref:L-aspartate oxidase n=1 Tax=uncultured Clostridium sp. TaxID=59620 RepID=UPI0025E380F6|nr:L-aspartate oxidase [uncultured Clostridium sp.]